MQRKCELAAHIESLERALLTEDVRTSRAQFARLLDEAFFEFGSSGRVITIDANDETLGIVHMTLSDFQLHVLGDDIVLATYRINNEETKKQSLRSSIWRRIDNDWRMFFHQGTHTTS